MSRYLEERERYFLIKIVSEYIELAEPISSRHLSKLDDVDLSAATIRNIMLNLTEKGFLIQPHTSAGRIPSDLAYRMYVDHIEGTTSLEKEPILDKANPFHINMGIDDILKESLALLSDGTSCASLATTPDPACLKLKSIEFLKISRKRVLTILVTESGIVKTKTITPREDLPALFLTELGSSLTKFYEGLPINKLQDNLLQTLSGKDFGLDDHMFAHAVRLSKKALDWSQSYSMMLHGQTHVMNWFECTSKHEINKICQEIEDGNNLVKAMDNHHQLNRAYFKIGNEIKLDVLTECSLVIANYGIHEDKVGTIGVIGPKRMDYKKIASLVEHLASVISNNFQDDY
ncbi:MAG: heat-inducible transcription repressor HrcA [SAR324 cluster bacterium]|nr:heat-inducible transcription repressor HrcA [SAR324 cluster bacterium]